MLPQLMPKAIEWGESQATRVAEMGYPLNDVGKKIARAVGVREPERIRVEFVDDIPAPEEKLLKEVAAHTGLLGFRTSGITFGHSVMIRRGQESVRLLSHEFRHVEQYEQYGSISAFLQEYLHQIVETGYEQAPLEQDARGYELPDAGNIAFTLSSCLR